MKEAKILNWKAVPAKNVDDPEFKSKMKTLRLGEAAGSRKLYVNIDYVKPGAKSVKYHSHSEQEEFFLILEGSGTLRMNNKETQVKKGDFVSKPAGEGIAHQFINTGTEVLAILDCGLNNPDDIVTYPDENTTLIKKTLRAYQNNQELKNWNQDPNA